MISNKSPMAEKHMPDWCETEVWCPVTVTSELLGRKWHPVIIHRLIDTTLGFNELQRAIGTISDKVLSDSLSDLQEKDIVQREVVNETPKQVQYSLTETGRSLKPVIAAMYQWGQENADQL